MEDYVQDCKFCWGEGGEGIVRESEVDMYAPLYLQWIANRIYCIVHGTLLNALCQPGWERGLGENGDMYMYS